MKIPSPMELLTLFHKSDNADVNLTVHEKALYSSLITFINKESGEEFKAWPNTDTLIRRTGLGDRTIERSRKVLLAQGWIKTVVYSRGPGTSNVYYINAAKIVEVAAMSGNKASVKDVPESKAPKQLEPHKRNTSGLMRGKKAPEQPVAPSVAQDEHCPWFGAENVSEAVLVPPEATTDGNADGSPKFFKNGARRYTWEDVMPALQEVSQDDPF